MDIESTKSAIISIVKGVLTEKYPKIFSELTDSFTKNYGNHLKKHESEDNSDLLRYFRITTAFRPVLATILETVENDEHNEMCNQIATIFDETLDQDRIREENSLTIKKPVTEVKYHCMVCNKTFDIPPEKKREIEESGENFIFPLHCGKEMNIKIVRTGLNALKAPLIPIKSKVHVLPNYQRDINQLKILSVGIDVGSSTSHLVFSCLTLKREFSYVNKTNRFQIVERELVYQSDIIFTPLLDVNTIDIEKLIEFFRKEYKKAGFTPEMVDTGAVIVTGETAKKDNASLIVKQLSSSSSSGKFVSASAGANFESMLGIMGSGMVDESLTDAGKLTMMANAEEVLERLLVQKRQGELVQPDPSHLVDFIISTILAAGGAA